MSAILTRDLTKTYGKNRGVRNIGLQVEEGEVFGFIGPNGAGKSTTIRMLMQLIRPTSGEISLLDRKVTGDDAELRRQIGYLPSEVNLYRDMSGRQMLDFAADAYNLPRRSARMDKYAELLQFDVNKRVKSYSLGNRKKLGILLSLIHRPKLLILDEPTSGLDPLVQHDFFDLLQQLNGEGMTIFFSTHNLTEVERICGRVAIIREGQIIRVSKVDEIAGRSRRTIRVRYTEDGDQRSRYGLLAIDPNAAYSGGFHVLAVEDSIDRALHEISRYAIRDIVVEKPSLEELFMQYYRQDKEAE